jgi:hypothetical protein
MLHRNHLTEFGSRIMPEWNVAIAAKYLGIVAIPAKYFARAWQFHNGGFCSSDQGLRSGSDTLHHTDMTQFRSHIVP